jgi:hypothetical protein
MTYFKISNLFKNGIPKMSSVGILFDSRGLVDCRHCRVTKAIERPVAALIKHTSSYKATFASAP